MASFYANGPASSSGSASANPSVGLNGAPEPTSSTQIGFSDSFGNLQAVSPSEPLPVTIDGGLANPLNVNLADVAGTATATGIGASNAGTQRVAVSSDSTIGVTGNVTVVQPSGSALHVDVDNFPASQVVSQPTASLLNATVVTTSGATIAEDAHLTNVQSAPGTPQTVAVTVQGNASGVPMPISGTVTITPSGEQNVNLNQVGGSAISIGQQLSAASLPVVLPASQITTLTPPTTVTVTQASGSNLHVDVDASALPTGASTSTLQSSVQSAPGTPQTVAVTVQGNASGVPVPVSGAITTTPAADTYNTTGTITTQDLVTTSTTYFNGQVWYSGTPTAGSFAAIAINNLNSVDIEITGTWTGTLQSEVSFDGGTNWILHSIHQIGSAAFPSSYTNNIVGSLNAAGKTNVRVRATAPITGTANIRFNESVNSTNIYVANPIKLVDASSNTSTIQANILAASTAASASNTALVVALSPNSPLPNSVLPTAMLNGEKTSTGTAVAIGTGALTAGVLITGKPENVGIVYVGNSSVTTSGANRGFPLLPYQTTSAAIANLNEIYVIAATSGDGVDYLGS